MKKLFFFFSFLLFIPIALALYGGETKTYHFDECDILRVNITGTEEIIEGEYIILNNCTRNETNYYICDCTDDYDFNVTFKINTINNYTFKFNYDYSKEKQTSSGGGGGGGSSRIRTKVCTPYWKCTEWGNCQSNSRATRECNDLNECNATRPSEERYCYYYVPKVISVEAQEEGIEQVEVITPIEPIEQPEPQEEEGVAFISRPIWWIIIGVFIMMVIIVIVFIVKSRENQ